MVALALDIKTFILHESYFVNYGDGIMVFHLSICVFLDSSFFILTSDGSVGILSVLFYTEITCFAKVVDLIQYGFTVIAGVWLANIGAIF